MNFLIFSDAHGNNRDMLRAWSRQPKKPDGIFFLGDGLNRIEPDLFDDIPLICVRGNCDFFAPLWHDCPTEQTLCFEGHTILLTHGATFGVKGGLGMLERASAEMGADIVLFGHTHVPYLETIPAGETVGNTKLTRPLYLFNPGSIGYSGSFGHLYLTADTVLLSHGTVQM